MSTTALQGITTTIPASGEMPVEIADGRFFAVKEASEGASFHIAFDDGGYVPWDAGMAYQAADGDGAFARVMIRNNGATPITLEIIAGRGRVYDARLTVVSNRMGTIAQEGVDGTGIVPPVGGEGIRGWLSGIFNKLGVGPQTVLNSTSVVPPLYTVAIVTAVTDGASGANWTAFASTGCRALEIVNNTGTAIEYRRGGSGDSIHIANGTSRKIEGILNAGAISVRRVDQSSTSVTVRAETFI